MWKQCCKAAIESILPPFMAYSNYLELFGELFGIIWLLGIIWNYLELFVMPKNLGYHHCAKCLQTVPFRLVLIDFYVVYFSMFYVLGS